jgi:hypothetical protein
VGGDILFQIFCSPDVLQLEQSVTFTSPFLPFPHKDMPTFCNQCCSPTVGLQLYYSLFMETHSSPQATPSHFMETHSPLTLTPTQAQHKHKDRSVVHSIVHPLVHSLFVCSIDRSSNRSWFVCSFVRSFDPLYCQNFDRSSVHNPYSSFIIRSYELFIIHRSFI